MEIAKKRQSILNIKQNVIITSAVNFTSGIIHIDKAFVELLENASLVDESEKSYITTSNSGHVKIVVILNKPGSVNPGKLGAIISSKQNLGKLTISRGHDVQKIEKANEYSIQRYYDIEPENNKNLDATLEFEYYDTELNGISENNLTLWKSKDNSSWSEQGFIAKDDINNYVVKDKIYDFSRWTLSIATGALPLRFL